MKEEIFVGLYLLFLVIGLVLTYRSYVDTRNGKSDLTYGTTIVCAVVSFLPVFNVLFWGVTIGLMIDRPIPIKKPKETP